MLTPEESRLREALMRRRDAMIDDLRALVSLPTGPGGDGVGRCRDLLTGRAADVGANIETRDPDPRPDWLYSGTDVPSVDPSATAAPDLRIAVCRRDNTPAGAHKPVLIAGHLDTVHPASSPFREISISPDATRATGPGCADMKGGLVIAIHALEALEECGVRIPWTLLLNADEETGSFASARAIRTEAKRIAAAGGIGIALEPCLPSGAIVTERSGSGQFMLEARGKSAHVGRDFAAGASAVAALAHAIARCHALANPAGGLIVNFGPLQGGATTNSVPDLARAWGNIRFKDAAGAAHLERELRSIAQAATAHVPGTSIALHINLARPAKPLTPQVQALADTVRTAATHLSLPIDFASTGGVCDGNLMQDEGLPTLDTLGVLGGGLHTTDEWVDLDSMPDRAALLALSLVRATGS